MSNVAKLKDDPPLAALGGGVYAKIAAVQGALARHGIGKDRTNSTPGANYRFRGIDDVYNALSPLLAEHGLCILPRIIGHELRERGKTSKGNPIFAAIVDAEFDFVSSDDGSKHTIRTFGEAMDSSDKATNKAMSAAYKYAAFMAFAIPTEGDNDADATTIELANHTPQRVNDSDLAKIIQLCEAVGGNQAQLICNAYKIDALPELTPSQSQAVIGKLTDKLAAKAQAETNLEAANV